jgi:hypothetical protein
MRSFCDWRRPEADQEIECRMSNSEFRMTKLNFLPLSFGVLDSLFDILRFAFDLALDLRHSCRPSS